MTTETPCQRCGTFLPAGRARLCEACEKLEARQVELRRTARLMALCLGVASLVLMSVQIFTVIHGRFALREALAMLGFGLVSAGGLIAGGLGVLWRRSPWPGWAGAGAMLLCPQNWLWLLMEGPGARKWGVLFGLAVTSAVLAVALGVKLRQQGRGARGPG